ncbi:MAG TPA: hypothetical protein PKA00_11085 [Saprospiraceae bacterium]|nr:hypothetical protein [Saprospiraceae bacterium]HMQ83446.1 hypothetical protein [Saprospiraceae bacterium]
MNSLNTLFSNNLFWDIEEDALDSEKNARFIIERVLSQGRLRDWFALVDLYGLDKIKHESLKIRYLDKVTLNFCSKLFNVPKSKFRCYKQPQSIQQLWQF